MSKSGVDLDPVEVKPTRRRFDLYTTVESANVRTYKTKVTNYLTLPIGARFPEIVNAVVEIPRGQANKYEYDKTLHVFRLDRTLYSPVHFPGDYGFIPSTLSGDGDGLDVLILVNEPSFPGCLIEVRPIGLLLMTDQGASDEKVLAVATSNPHYRGVGNYTEVYPHVLLEIEHFFTIYKDLENKRTKVIEWRDVPHAQAVINESHQRFIDASKKAMRHDEYGGIG